METNNSTTQFYLMRHASTLWNEEKRMQGHKDIPLSSKGRQDAEKWGKTLKPLAFKRILVSPLIRAFETATIINTHLNLPLHTDLRLKEQNLGLWEGRKINSLQIEARQLLQKAGGNGWDFCPPGGEPRLDVVYRVENALCEYGKKWYDESILIVTHHGAIKFLINRLKNVIYTQNESIVIYSHTLHILKYSHHSLFIKTINVPLL